MKIDSAFHARYQPVFTAIARKLTPDKALREDLVQWAWEEILKDRVVPRLETKQDPYVRRVAQLTMLSRLASWNTGDWFTGRGDQKSRYLRVDRLIETEQVQYGPRGELLPGEGAESDSLYVTRRMTNGGATVLLTL